MIFLDLSHTSHSTARTGIQRVARGLQAELAARGLGCEITWDPYAREWRPLEAWEQAQLAAPGAGTKRGASWPAGARWRGRWRRWHGGRGPHSVGWERLAALLARTAPAPSSPSPTHRLPGTLLVPELFSADVAAALPTLRRQLTGPSVALFHDAIALQFPELSPPKTVARFPFYLRELAQFDRIAAVSEESRTVLLDYWRWLGWPQPPPVAAIPLGIDVPAALPRGGAGRPTAAPPTAASAGTDARPLRLLCVGTLEARKNHLALLEAAETLWRAGARCELRLIGITQMDTGRAARARVAELQAAGRPLRYDGPVDEATLAAAYAECDVTVYPSLYEGFGLPVLESLAAGKPCVCSAQGALGESAAGGGCATVAQPDAASLAACLSRLLTRPDELAALTAAARRRTFRTWRQYVDDLLAWLEDTR